MMAKMFYTLDETKAALGRSEDEVRQLAREGRLREFRDGPRLMFKADQVEQLKSELGEGDIVDIGVSDSGGLINMVDTTGASGTSITLSDPGQSSGTAMRLVDSASASASGIPLADTGTGMMSGTGAPVMGGTDLPKEDTALAMDLGLSGSIGGVPSPGRPGGTAAGSMAGGSVAGGKGINVFSSDDTGFDRVDAGAQTVISSGARNQFALEGVGSGSGLLDLTREADDTSLGAVLEEITPGESRSGQTGIVEIESEPVIATPRATMAATQVEAYDPMAIAFGLMALAGAGTLMFIIYALICAVVGTRPPVIQWFADNANQFLVFAGMAVGLTIVLFIIGAIAGRSSAARR